MYQDLDSANEKDTAFRLLKVLVDAYQPDEPFANLEEVRLLYARKLYDKGDKTAARDLVNGIQTFSGLVGIATDPDFRALQDPKVDLRLAAERQYVEDQVTLS